MKYCPNCGTALEDNAVFCSECGTKVSAPVVEEAAAPVVEEAPVMVETPAVEPAPVYAAPVQAAPVSNGPLVMAIIGAVFGCTVYFAFVGIILCAIAGKKAKETLAVVSNGKMKAASIVAKIGLILSIVFTALIALVILLAVIAVIAEG